MKRNRPCLIAIVAASLLLAPAGGPATAAPAAAPTAKPASTASPDYDGDGRADVAAVFYPDQMPAIRVWYGSGRVADLTQTQLGLDEWGIHDSLLARDLNGDGYTDLIIETTAGSRLLVTTVPGSAGGLSPAGRYSLPLSTNQNTTVRSLALVESPVRRLAVALSTLTETKSGGTHRAEELRLYRLTSAGKPTGSPLTLRPGTGKVPKQAKNGSFGETLASWGNQLFVGAPAAKVNGRKGAGAVFVVTLGSTAVTAVRTITQASRGVTGAAGTYDYFGNSLAARDGYLVVGTPGDDVGSVKHTGSIQLFSLSKGRVTPVKRISQASPGVPGKAERFDLFGDSVAVGTGCSDGVSVLVGAPGEVLVKDHQSDGSAWLIPLRSAKGCKARQLYPGHGLPGKPGWRAIGQLVGFARDRGAKVDDLLIAGGGSYSEGPAGWLYRVSGSTGKTLVSHESLYDALAGR